MPKIFQLPAISDPVDGENRLTELQRSFVDELVADPSGGISGAANRAGYSPEGTNICSGVRP